MINVKIKLKSKKTAKFIENLMKKNPNARRKSLLHTAFKQSNTIKKRTDKGVGVFGRFKDYTPEYKKFKQSIGQNGIPNLQVSNFMLSNITVKGNTNKSSIYFPNQKAKELASYNDKTRPFFSVTDKEEKQLIKNFEQQIFKHLGL